MTFTQRQAVKIGGGDFRCERFVPCEFQDVEAAAELRRVGEGRELAKQRGIGLALHGEQPLAGQRREPRPLAAEKQRPTT